MIKKRCCSNSVAFLFENPTVVIKMDKGHTACSYGTSETGDILNTDRNAPDRHYAFLSN